MLQIDDKIQTNEKKVIHPTLCPEIPPILSNFKNYYYTFFIRVLYL